MRAKFDFVLPRVPSRAVFVTSNSTLITSRCDTSCELDARGGSGNQPIAKPKLRNKPRMPSFQRLTTLEPQPLLFVNSPAKACHHTSTQSQDRRYPRSALCCCPAGKSTRYGTPVPRFRVSPRNFVQPVQSLTGDQLLHRFQGRIEPCIAHLTRFVCASV